MSARARNEPVDGSDQIVGGDVLALEICRLFFDDQCSKKEIGERLGISRFRVARLIDQARASGLVRIEYRDRDLIDRGLSTQVAALYGLRLCVVVSAAGRGEEDVREAVGSAAASIVADLIGPGDVVGLGWGRSVAAMVENLPPAGNLDIDVVQLAGGSARTAFGVDPSELARRFALRLGGRLHAIYAPALVKTQELRDALLREPDIADSVALFDSITLAMLGVGALSGKIDQPPASALSISGVLTSDALEQVLAGGAVGELMLHPFDLAGRFVGDPIRDRGLAISIDQLRRSGRVLALASGIKKGPAIQGALRSGVATMLVTDDAAARWLVENAAPVGTPATVAAP